MERNKIELQKKLKELKTQLIGISKDTHFAEKLIDDLLLVKGQIVVEPTELNVGEKIDGYKGETFEIVKTNRGVLYHEYGGYNIFATPSQTALYSTLVDYVDSKDVYSKLEGEMKETFDLNQSAIAYCLSIPKFCFSDVEFTYEIATKAIEFLRKAYENAMEQPLQEETIEEDQQFKDATLGLEDVKDAITEYVESIKEEE